MELWSVVLIAVALSADVFGVGLSCAVRGVKITWTSRLVICLMSAVLTLCGVLGGKVILNFISAQTASVLGGLLLCLLGCSVVWGGFVPKQGKKKENKPYEKILAVKTLGITIRIIRDPKQCDLDGSSVLDFREALYTGAAVSADSLAAGVSFGTGTWGLASPLLCGGFQLVFLCAGLYLGGKIRKSARINSRLMTALSGFILIIIGILTMV